MSQKRLTDLTLLNIHRNIPIDTIKLIERFSKTNRKLLDFVI
ncbi:52 kDa repressor of the inhibitor of the protein kinase-like [Aphis craccivora]|uniref:52 kDa repressor of the inhibitor of the protein kinase-like n=1 Tax=Aphis craccivora TaxID=307492 RepID=A0A6G0YLG1_APHCR|nr:52 kDa repressor of the inhibitor of the protein kinase-like [Aphis craccivora]